MSFDAYLSGRGFQLVATVDGYELPHVETGSDANWLRGAVELVVGETVSFRASAVGSFYAPDIETFCRAVQGLDGDTTTEATLPLLEGAMTVTVSLKDGRPMISGALVDEDAGELRFWKVRTRPGSGPADIGNSFAELVEAFPSRPGADRPSVPSARNRYPQPDRETNTIRHLPPDYPLDAVAYELDLRFQTERVLRQTIRELGGGPEVIGVELEGSPPETNLAITLHRLSTGKTRAFKYPIWTFWRLHGCPEGSKPVPALFASNVTHWVLGEGQP